MTTILISLRALRQPVTLVSLALLLINDHILKSAAPSWITGKLSDFAGLFFFPFLFAVVLALPFEALSVKPRRTFGLACVLTALWFALMKLTVPINEVTEGLVSWLLSAPAQIVMDATDLIALPMIWLAWQMWVHLESKPTLRPVGWVAFAGLGVGALATLATSCVQYPRVGTLNVQGTILYAGYLNAPVALVQSDDYGATWTEAKEVPLGLEDLTHTYPDYNALACAAENVQVCYRIVGGDYIERSTDGGQSWSLDWKWPVAREEFYTRSSGAFLCSSDPYTSTPQDLVVMSSGTSHVVIVSMGYDGVLVRETSGQWVRQAVLKATPMPYSVPNLETALRLTISESIGVLVASFLGISILLTVERRKQLKAAPVFGNTTLWTAPAFLISVVAITIFAMSSVLGLQASSPFIIVTGMMNLVMLGFSPVVGLLVATILAVGITLRLAEICILLVGSRLPPERSRYLGLLVSSIVSLLSFVPFLLWTYGVIENYVFALIVSGAIFVIAMASGLVFSKLQLPEKS